MGELSLLVVAIAEPLPSSIVTWRQPHHQFNHIIRPRTTRSSTMTMTMRRREEDPAIQAALLLLQQRPQYPHHPPLPSPALTPHKTNDHKDDGEEEQSRSTRGVLGTAMDVLRLMDGLQLPVEEDMYLSLVKECTDTRDAVQGAKVHAHIQQNFGTLLGRPAGLLLANRLLIMYGACGHPDRARLLFDQMPVRDAISWATMIAAISDKGSHREVLHLFAYGWLTSCSFCCCCCCAEEVITTVLRSCIRTRELGFGQQVHGLTLKMAEGDGDKWQLGSPLVQFYAILGHHQSAQKVFDRMSYPHRDAAAWTCMIKNACGRDGGGRFTEALNTFREMGRAGSRKNCHTFSSILPACARMEDEGRSGRQVHTHAIKIGVELDRFVGSSLVDMYSKCGLLGDARRAFDSQMTINNQDAVCWNAMLSGYVQRGCCTEALRFLYEMKAAGIEPQECMLDQVRLICGG